LRAATPRFAEDAGAVEDRLYQLGETRTPFRLEGLLTAAETLHLPAPFEIIHIGVRRVVVRAGTGAFLFALVGSAIRAVDRAGAVSVHDLPGMLRNRCSVADLEELLPLHPRFEWLEDTRSWFWFRPTLSPKPGRVRNRLVNKISKVISIAGPIHRGQLRNLIMRRRLFAMPPDAVLLELYRRIPWILIREDSITRVEMCDTIPPHP
jgi:hypothetical protein